MTFQDSYDPATDDPGYRDTLMAHNRVKVFQDYGGPNLDWKPDFTELLGLMLRTETTLGASLDKQPTPEFSPLDGYNGVDDVMGTPYETYAVSFAFSRSPQETAHIKRRIDQAQKHQTVFSQAGTGALLGTGLVAGMLEPLNLLFAAAPGVMTSVGKSLLQTARAGARVGAAQAGVVEGALHHFQPDRTLEQSMLDISFSAGAGASLLPMFAVGKKLYGRMEMDHPELLRAMDESLREELRTGTTTGFTGHINPGWRPERPGERRWAPGINNPATPGARVHPDMPSRGSDATPTGFRAYGAERISNALSKRDLVLNGEISSSARAMENLVTTPSYLQKNFENVATDLPVAREMKTWDATLAEFLSDINHAHTAYRMRIAGRKGDATLKEKAFIIAQDVAQRINHPKNLTGAPSRADPDGPLSIIRFREEVTATLRRAETDGKIKHDIPEIEQMAQRVRDTNDYIFSEAVTAGVMKEGDYRPNFVPRMWDQPMVFKQEAELKEIIMRWQRENLPEELRDSSKQLSDKMSAIHTSIDGIENLSTEALQSHKGIFKQRSINVPDEIIADFLVGDIDHIMRSYVRLASADIEISRKFGSISMEKTFEAIRREAADMDARAASGVIPKHQKAAEKHIEYLEAYRDILRGVYQLPTDPYSIPSRTARLVLDFNTWTMLGGATLSSVPDIGRSVMMNGLEPTFHGVRALIKDFDTWKVAAKEVKTAGTALDMMLQTRALALAMTGDLPQRYTKIERVAGYMTNGFFIANMLSPWNAFMKQAVGVSTSHRILELVKQDLNGTISAKNRARLRAAYISLEDSRLIDNAYSRHGETVNGLKIPNTERWAEDPTRPTRTDEPAAEPVGEGMPDTGPSIPGRELPEVFNQLDVIINRLERFSDQWDTSTPKSVNIDELNELIASLGPTEFGPQGMLSTARIARNQEILTEVRGIVDDFRQQIDVLRTAIKNENVDDIKIASAAISRLIEQTRPPRGLGRLTNPEAEKLDAHPRARLAEAIDLLEMEDTVGRARDTLFQRIDEVITITSPLGRDFRGVPTGHKEAIEANKALNKQFKTLNSKYKIVKRSPKRVLSLVRDNISLIHEYFGPRAARLILSDVEDIANGAKLGSKRNQFGIRDSMDEVLGLTRELIDKDPSGFNFNTPRPAEPTPGLPPRTDETPVAGGRAEADNLRAQRVFRAALARDVDQAIVTPEAGDLPLFTYKIWGRILGQYKSFIASAFHKVLIPGMQMRDAQTMMGMMMMVFMGGLVTMIRDKQNGVPVADEPLEFIVDGIDQSGVTSWFFVANNAIEAWSDNRYGLRPSLGVGPWWSTSMRWKMGSVLGPSASQAVRIGDIMGDVLSGDADWRTRRSAWRLVPGNNLLPLNLGNVIQFNNWIDQMQEFPTPDMSAHFRNQDWFSYVSPSQLQDMAGEETIR